MVDRRACRSPSGRGPGRSSARGSAGSGVRCGSSPRLRVVAGRAFVVGLRAGSDACRSERGRTPGAGCVGRRDPASSRPRCGASCGATCAPTPTRGTCTPPTRACTRVEPLLVAFPRGADDVAAAVEVAGALRRPGRLARRRHEPRGPGGGRARDRARPLAPPRRDRRDRRREARRVRVEPGRRAGGAQRRRQAARARLRPGHLDLQPGHARRHDRQQLLGQRVDRARHDDRPRARARGRARRRLARHASGRSTRRSGRAARGRTRSRARSAAGCPGSSSATPARSPRTTRGTGASRAATGSTASRPPAGSTSRSSSPARRARSSRSPRRP